MCSDGFYLDKPRDSTYESNKLKGLHESEFVVIFSSGIFTVD